MSSSEKTPKPQVFVLRIEDIPVEHRSWMAPIVTQINRFVQQTYVWVQSQSTGSTP